MTESPTAAVETVVKTKWYRSNIALIALGVVAGVALVAAKVSFGSDDSTPETD